MSMLSPAEDWLAISQTDQPDIFKIEFQEHHIGNPIIRSVHGGVVGSLIEHAAEGFLKHTLTLDNRTESVELASSSIDYLRVTKDAPLFARASMVRMARRVAFMNVYVWQDDEEMPVARGTCTLRILPEA